MNRTGKALAPLFMAVAFATAPFGAPAYAQGNAPKEIDFESVCEEPPIPMTKGELLKVYEDAHAESNGIDYLEITETPVPGPDTPAGAASRYALLKIVAGDHSGTSVLYVLYDNKKEDTNRYYPHGLWVSKEKSFMEKFCYTTEKAYNQILAGETPDPVDRQALPPIVAPPGFSF